MLHGPKRTRGKRKLTNPTTTSLITPAKKSKSLKSSLSLSNLKSNLLRKRSKLLPQLRRRKRSRTTKSRQRRKVNKQLNPLLSLRNRTKLTSHKRRKSLKWWSSKKLLRKRNKKRNLKIWLCPKKLTKTMLLQLRKARKSPKGRRRKRKKRLKLSRLKTHRRRKRARRINLRRSNQKRSSLRRRRNLRRRMLLCMSKRRSKSRHSSRRSKREMNLQKLMRTRTIRQQMTTRKRPKRRKSKGQRPQETMKTRSQGSQEFSKTSILSTTMVTGREVQPRCLSLWRLLFLPCLRSLWKSPMRLSSPKLRKLLRKILRILELKWRISPRNSKKNLTNLLPTKINKIQIKKN